MLALGVRATAEVEAALAISGLIRDQGDARHDIHGETSPIALLRLKSPSICLTADLNHRWKVRGAAGGEAWPRGSGNHTLGETVTCSKDRNSDFGLFLS